MHVSGILQKTKTVFTKFKLFYIKYKQLITSVFLWYFITLNVISIIMLLIFIFIFIFPHITYTVSYDLMVLVIPVITIIVWIYRSYRKYEGKHTFLVHFMMILIPTSFLIYLIKFISRFYISRFYFSDNVFAKIFGFSFVHKYTQEEFISYGVDYVSKMLTKLSFDFDSSVILYKVQMCFSKSEIHSMSDWRKELNEIVNFFICTLSQNTPPPQTGFGISEYLFIGIGIGVLVTVFVGVLWWLKSVPTPPAPPSSTRLISRETIDIMQRTNNSLPSGLINRGVAFIFPGNPNPTKYQVLVCIQRVIARIEDAVNFPVGMPHHCLSLWMTLQKVFKGVTGHLSDSVPTRRECKPDMRKFLYTVIDVLDFRYQFYRECYKPRSRRGDSSQLNSSSDDV